jgi:hypothetical protein
VKNSLGKSKLERQRKRKRKRKYYIEAGLEVTKCQAGRLMELVPDSDQ